MALELRYYQRDAVLATYNHLRTKSTNPCVVLPTAAGKSLCLAQIAVDAVEAWHGRVLVLAHVKELLEQNAGKISALSQNIKPGIYSAGLNSYDAAADVVVAGIQSVYNKAGQIGHRDICIIDECQLIPVEGDSMYRRLIGDLLKINPKMRVVGFTATDYRMGTGPICAPENILNEVCYEIGIRELVDKGYLSKIVSKSGRRLPDLSALHVRCGEFVAEEVDAAMNRDDLIADACREIVSYAKNRKACLVFCASVAHAENVAKMISRISGEECPVVTCDTPDGERDSIIRRLRGETANVDLFGNGDGPLRYVCNVNVLSVGTDIPRLDTIAFLRATASPGLFVQAVGRGFRLSPETGKTECLVLDYGRNIERFGPIDLIKGRSRSPGDSRGPLVKTCPECRELIPIALMKCPSCGYEYPEPERKASLDSSASTLAVLSGEVTTETLEVTDVEYEPWTKRNSPPGAKRTVRVTYWCGLNERYCEWICPEHTGFARMKFEKWFLARRASEDVKVPATVDDFLEMEFMGMVRKTKDITLRRVAGERYPDVVASTPGDLPDNSPFREGAFDEEDMEDLPF